MTNEDLVRDSYAVLLPAFTELKLSDSVTEFLTKGGCSILLAETRAEYVNREMSAARKANEKGPSILGIVNDAKKIQPNLIVAVDQEFGGICRLHGLVPSFPKSDNSKEIQTSTFETICSEVATEAKRYGVNCFLAPILDIIIGVNPWLQGRTWSTNLNEVSRLSSAFIRGVQKSKVISTAKHFPGFSNIKLDPAIESNAIMDDSLDIITKSLLPFKEAIDNHVEIIMVGPAIVKEIDSVNPASISNKVISILRDEINFNGIILSDDLDAKATLKNYEIEEVAIKALQAGCDYLLLADMNDQIIRVAEAIQQAVLDNEIKYSQLKSSADKVRNVAIKYT